MDQAPRAGGRARPRLAEVDPDLEITEIVDRTVKAGGPALLFEHPKGSKHPLLINQFGTERRMCLAFDAASLDEVAGRLEAIIEMQPPQGLVEKVRGLAKLKSIADSMPKSVRSAPARRSSSRATTSTSTCSPIQRCWPGDPAPFITLPAVITKDPHTGTRNVGMYRMQKIDRRSTFMHWQIHKDGGWTTSPRTAGSTSRSRSASTRSPPTRRARRSRSTSTSSCSRASSAASRSSSCRPRPSTSRCRRTRRSCSRATSRRGDGLEGPFGDHTGYYSPAEPFPVFHLTAITMRRDAIYPSIVVGKPPAEDAWLGKATERIFLPAIRMTVPEIVDYDLPVAGAFHNCGIVSIRKAFPGHAQKVMHAIWGLGLLSLTKSVVVVDEHVDVHDYEEVFFRVCANVDPKRDVLLSEGRSTSSTTRRRSSSTAASSGSTPRTRGRRRARGPWPEEIVMSDEISGLVDRRWSTAYPSAVVRSMRHSPRRVKCYVVDSPHKRRLNPARKTEREACQS